MGTEQPGGPVHPERGDAAGGRLLWGREARARSRPSLPETFKLLEHFQGGMPGSDLHFEKMALSENCILEQQERQ